VVYTLVTVPSLRPRRRDVRREMVRRIAPFSAAMLALSVAAQITYYSGNIVVGAALGAGSAAVFAVASRLVEGITQLINQFGDIFLPSFARLSAHGREDDARSILVGGTTATLVLGYPAIAVLVGLGAPLILLWVGDGFDDSWLPLVLLCGGVAFTAPIRFGVLHAIGAARHGAIARVAMVEAVANLALGILLVNLVGVWGMALAVVTSLAVSNGIIIPQIVYPQVGLSTWRDYHRRTLLASAPLLPLAAVLHLLIGPAVEGSWLLLFVAAAAGYALGVVAVTVMLGEQARVRGLVQRVAGARRAAAAEL
jgi:O-antigen/teichoic acid export membrane protein